MYPLNNGRFKEAIIFWDTDIDRSADVDVFFFIHDYEGRAEYKYGFKSLEIDLNKTEAEIISDFQSRLRNDLKHADDMGFMVKNIEKPTNDQIDLFVSEFNKFADFKNLTHISSDFMKVLSNDGKLNISYVYKNDQLIAGHSHYCADGKARLYQSFSTYNDLSNKENALANKLLTREDIMHFKNHGFKIYDFGGIGNVDGDNSRFEGIIQFKKLFGGKEVILWKGITPNGERGLEVMKKYFSQIVFKK